MKKYSDPPSGQQAENKAPKRVTILDVARAARVSAGTVSNALSGKRQVDPETRARIDAAIAALGYVPNRAARALRHGRSNLIAVCSSMPWQVAGGSSRLGFLMEVVAAVAPVALRHGIAVTLLPAEAEAEGFLDRIALDGAIVIEPLREDPFLRALRAQALPVVVIGQPPVPDWVHVDLDYPAVTRLLCDHLYGAGARRFPLLTGQEDRVVHEETIRAYRAFAAERGMVPEVLRLPEAAGEAGSAALMTERLARRDIDAVLVPVDTFASGVMAAARGLGLVVPHDLRIATRYDGLRARQEVPGLTAVDLNLPEAAAHCIRLLLALIAGEGVPPATPVAPPRLIPRGSTR
ncbi:substrate-binding domain-containing protein [Paenirhodobacter sp.]|uniref:substrate-binding domain-containing protein n=1 Tax=Paenirhodobacter sp. TaxID=1965326 RepID=UPI003B4047B2